MLVLSTFVSLLDSHLSSIISHLSSIISHLSSIISHLSSIISHLSSIIYHLSSITYHLKRTIPAKALIHPAGTVLYLIVGSLKGRMGGIYNCRWEWVLEGPFTCAWV